MAMLEYNPLSGTTDGVWISTTTNEESDVGLMGKLFETSPLAQRQRRIVYGLMAIGLVIAFISLTLLILQLQHRPPKPDIAVDFGSRQNHSHPIHTQFGIAGGGMLQVIDQVSPYLAPANITLDSYIVQMQNIFTDPTSLTNSSKQDWSTLDSILSKVRATLGSHPLLTLQGVPAWLQPQNQKPPSPNYCLSDPNRSAYPFHAFPTHRTAKGDDGLALYSQLPALVVAHLDKFFPDIHPNYELWNEPDGYHSWCTSLSDPRADQTRFMWYKAIYTASAPLMEAQARRDHVQIQIGGPTLAYYAHFDTWFPKFLNDLQMAPYINFVTYHHYAGGQVWDDTHHPTQSIVGRTQDPQVGYAAIYEKVSKYVREGKQPNAQATPIYISEYNCTNSCLRSPIYAPLWNALMIADLLNTVDDKSSKYGVPLSLPAGLAYWAWNLKNYCMFGTLDAELDCSAAQKPLQPYPAYYCYLLLGSKKYLGLADGGYVANAATTTTEGLVITGFYTNSKENILVVNISGRSYPQLTIQATNPGLVRSTASYYTLNQANPHIGTQEVDLSSVDSGYDVTVNLTAYSTVALSLDVSSLHAAEDSNS